MLTVSASSQPLPDEPKGFVYGFKPYTVDSLEHLGWMANRQAVSGPVFQDGRRTGSNALKGSRVILIDCDEEGASEILESKLYIYDYVKVPSASNIFHPYKWHYFIPTQDPLSIFPAAYRWQVEQFFNQVGITNDLIDSTGSYDIARQFAPASIGMTKEEADDLIEVNETDLQAPIIVPPPELCVAGAKSVTANISGKTTDILPRDHLWFDGVAVTYKDIVTAVRSEETDIRLSGFGCPHDNHNHSGDRRSGYGFAWVSENDTVLVKCTGNECSNHPIFEVPEIHQELEKTFVQLEHLNEPVHPIEFAQRLKDILIGFNPDYVVSEKMIDVFHGFASTFNTIVKDNGDANIIPKRYVVPLATGSAKTTAAKLYLAMADVPSLLVVREASRAVEAARDINQWAKYDIAKCTYSIDASAGRPKTPEHITPKQLQHYKVIVITHKMFQNLHEAEEFKLDLYQLYNGTTREAIIIDERIDLKREESFQNSEIKEAIRIIQESTQDEYQDYITAMTNVNEIIFTYKKPYEDYKSRFMLFNEELPRLLKELKPVFELMSEALQSGKLRLTSRPKIRGMRLRDTDMLSVEKSIIDLMKRILFVLDGHILLHKSGNITTVSRVEDFSLIFGSAVILDATANINKTYEVYQQYQPDTICMFHKPNIRNYSNVTMHIASGFSQSKNKLYTIPSAKNGGIKAVVSEYLEAIYSVTKEEDKMLIVTYKDLLPTFREQCRVDNITFINWGMHAGSNQWSHYNKACIVGWYRIPQHIHASNMNMGAGSHLNLFTENYDRDVSAIADSLISDDMVQFLNRVRSRISIDEDGNCEPVDFYLFTDGGSKANAIIDTVVREFDSISVKEWDVLPTIKATKKKRSKVVDRADNIIALLKKKASTKMDVLAEDIRNELGTTKPAFRKTIECEYFLSECEWFGFKIQRLETAKGRPIIFDFSESQNL